MSFRYKAARWSHPSSSSLLSLKLGHRSSDVKSSTGRISSHLSNRALSCLQPASAAVCLRHTLRFANSKQSKALSQKMWVCKSSSLQVCRSAGLQVCSLRLSHTGFLESTLILLFVNECFTELYSFFWLLVVSLAILIACPCRLFSLFMTIACRSTQKCRTYQTLYKITHRYNWNH